MKSLKYLMKCLCITIPFVISGCGSSKQDTDSTSENNASPPASSPPPVTGSPLIEINSTELSVNAGESTEFQLKVTDDKGLTSFSMSCDEGLSLLLTNTPDGTTSYQSTPTITAEMYAIDTVKHCYLSFSDADNNTESIQVNVNITGINLLPVVSAGEDLTVDSATEVKIAAQASDPNFNGSIVSYKWTQTSGADIALSEADTNTVSFVSPTLVEGETYTFEVVAKDVDGAEGKDSVSVTVNPVQSVAVNVLFPLDGTTIDITDGGDLTVLGKVEVMEETSVSSVSLTNGVDTIEFTVEDDGSWRGNIKALGDNQVEIGVSAKASSGYTFETSLALNRELTFDGERILNIDNAVGSALDKSNNILYLQTSGFFVSDTNLYAFDLVTQTIKKITLTDINLTDDDLRQVPTDIELDEERNILYTSTSKSIFAIDLSTNNRSKLDVAFEYISDIDLDSTNNRLLLSDNGVAQVGTVDLTTFEQSYIPINTDLTGVNSIDYNAETNSLSITKYTFFDSRIIKYDMTNQILESNVDNAVIDSITYEMAISSDGRWTYFVDASGDLKAFDNINNSLDVLKEDVVDVRVVPIALTNQNGLELDDKNGLIYIFGQHSTISNEFVISILDIQSNTIATKPLL